MLTRKGLLGEMEVEGGRFEDRVEDSEVDDSEAEVEDSEAEGANRNGIAGKEKGFGKIKVVAAASRAANEQGVKILLSAPAVHREAPQRKLSQITFQMVGEGGAQVGGRGAATGALLSLAAKSSCLYLILELHESSHICLGRVGTFACVVAAPRKLWRPQRSAQYVALLPHR